MRTHREERTWHKAYMNTYIPYTPCPGSRATLWGGVLVLPATCLCLEAAVLLAFAFRGPDWPQSDSAKRLLDALGLARWRLRGGMEGA